MGFALNENFSIITTKVEGVRFWFSAFYADINFVI